MGTHDPQSHAQETGGPEGPCGHLVDMLMTQLKLGVVSWGYVLGLKQVPVLVLDTGGFSFSHSESGTHRNLCSLGLGEHSGSKCSHRAGSGATSVCAECERMMVLLSY